MADWGNWSWGDLATGLATGGIAPLIKHATAEDPEQEAAQGAADEANRQKGYTTQGAAANVGGSDQGYIQGQKALADRAAGYAGREAEQYGLAQAARNRQMSALDLAQAAALGKTPSAAEVQLQKGLQSSILAQQALASGARGPAGLAMAGYNAAANTAALQSQGIGQAAALRAEEMAAARGQFGQMASALRGQDLSALGYQGQMGADYNRFALAREQAQQQAQAEAARLRQGQWAAQAGMDQASRQQFWRDAIGVGTKVADMASKGLTAGAATG